MVGVMLANGWGNVTLQHNIKMYIYLTFLLHSRSVIGHLLKETVKKFK